MAWDTGTITSSTPWAALSAKLQALVGGTGVANWSYVKNIPAGTSIGQSGSASYSLDLFRCRGATNLYKRAVQVNLCNTFSNTDATSYAVTTVTPAASRFITVCVINSKASAADDPTSVSLDGSNAPTFTQIKSQAGGNAGEIKMTVWIGKSSASAPTGTNLTIGFGANTQTGCMVIVDQWDGCDLTLGVTSLDPTGSAQIGIAATGANGTTQTVHGVTMSSYLGAQSVVVCYAASSFTVTGGTYTNKAGWTPNAAGTGTTVAPILELRAAWRPNTNNTEIDLAPSLTISTATNETSWCSIGFEFQRTTQSTSITNANDAGRDWYFIIEIPSPDGAVNSSMTCAEDYDGNELFRRINSVVANVTPDSFDYSSSPTLAQYASVANSNRVNTIFTALNTSGFTYWIKLTNNGIFISVRVGATEKTAGAQLLDSFVTNTTDMPLVFLGTAVSLHNISTFTRLPGVVGAVTNAFGTSIYPWTVACFEGFTTNASLQQDLWANGKVHAGRIFVAHLSGRAAGNSGANNWGYARGLLKNDYLCVRSGGTVQLGDTMTIAGNTWTVIGQSGVVWGNTGSPAMFIVTRAN